MLDSDTDDSDRNDLDIVAQVILVVDSYISWTVDQWASKHHLFDFDRLSLTVLLNRYDSCFLHTDASLLDDLPLNKSNL